MLEYEQLDKSNQVFNLEIFKFNHQIDKLSLFQIFLVIEIVFERKTSEIFHIVFSFETSVCGVGH